VQYSGGPEYGLPLEVARKVQRLLVPPGTDHGLDGFLNGSDTCLLSVSAFRHLSRNISRRLSRVFEAFAATAGGR
jgi:hypothetical protein